MNEGDETYRQLRALVARLQQQIDSAVASPLKTELSDTMAEMDVCLHAAGIRLDREVERVELVTAQAEAIENSAEVIAELGRAKQLFEASKALEHHVRNNKTRSANLTSLLRQLSGGVELVTSWLSNWMELERQSKQPE